MRHAVRPHRPREAAEAVARAALGLSETYPACALCGRQDVADDEEGCESTPFRTLTVPYKIAPAVPIGMSLDLAKMIEGKS